MPLWRERFRVAWRLYALLHGRRPGQRLTADKWRGIVHRARGRRHSGWLALLPCRSRRRRRRHGRPLVRKIHQSNSSFSRLSPFRLNPWFRGSLRIGISFPTPVGTPGGKPQSYTARAKIAHARLDRFWPGWSLFSIFDLSVCVSRVSIPCVLEITHRHTFTFTFTFTQALHTPRRVPQGGGVSQLPRCPGVFSVFTSFLPDTRLPVSRIETC